MTAVGLESEPPSRKRRHMRVSNPRIETTVDAVGHHYQGRLRPVTLRRDVGAYVATGRIRRRPVVDVTSRPTPTLPPDWMP